MEKQIQTKEELKQHWKDCFIVGIRRKQTLKHLLEGFDLGITIKRSLK